MAESVARAKGSIESVAYVGNGKVLCRECALKVYAAAGGDKEALEDLTWDEDDELIYERTGLDALTRSQAERVFDNEVDGLYCDKCPTLILEPITFKDEEDVPSCSDVTGGVDDNDLFKIWGLRPDDTEVDEEGHLWARPWKLVGGTKKNPGVMEYNGGVVETRICLRCGTTRTTDTTTTVDGGYIVWDVSYDKNIYAAKMAQAGAKVRAEAGKRE